MAKFPHLMLLGFWTLIPLAGASPLVTKTNLNLRAGPSVDSPVKQVIEAGRTVYVWNTTYTSNGTDDWSQVLVGDQTGWVKSSFLDYENVSSPGYFLDDYLGYSSRIGQPTVLRFSPREGVDPATDWTVRIQKVKSTYWVRREASDSIEQEGSVQTLRMKGRLEQSADDGPVLLFDLPPLDGGGYIVSLARSGAPNAVVAAVRLYVTDLSVITKNTPGKVHFWAVNPRTGQAQPGANVKLYTLREGQLDLLGEGQTNAQGQLTLEAPRDREVNFLVTSGSSEAFTPGTYSYTPQGQRYRTLVMTDRPLYQLNDTLQISGVARERTGSRYQPYTGVAELRILDPLSNVLFSKSIKLDRMGMFRESLPLSLSRTGTYHAEVVIESDHTRMNPEGVRDTSFAPFLVQPYVKPSFDLAVTLPSEVVAGDVPLKVRSTLYSGGNTNGKADIFALPGYADDFYWSYESATQSDTDIEYEDEPEYDLEGGVFDQQDPESRVAQLAIKNGEGSATLKLKPRENKPTPYSIVVRALDEFGRKVTTSQNLTVYPSSLVLSVQSPDTLKAGSAAKLTVKVRKVGTTQPVANQVLEAKISRSTWEWSKDGWKEKVLQTVNARVTTDKNGVATVPFTPSGTGSIRLDLKAQDDKKRPASLSSFVGYLPEPAPERNITELTVDVPESRFKVGDTVPVTLTSNLPVGTLVWLTAEGREVYQQQVVSITGKTTRAQFRITQEMEPGFWVNVATHQNQKPLLTYYQAFVQVPITGKKLQVKVTPEKNVLQPGESSRLRIETSLNGKGVPATVVVGAVNEAVYALVEDAIPDPYRYFWGVPYGTDVVTTTSLPNLDSNDRGGGGGPGDSSFPRSRFRDTALFDTVTTNQNGVAVVPYTLPEDLARYRVLARAVTQETATGEAQTSVRSALGFYVRVVAPSFLTRGDEATVYTVVHNQTKAAIDATVGFKLPTGTLKKTVKVPAGGETKVPWIVKAPEQLSTLNLDTSVQGGNLQDAVSLVLPIRETTHDFEVSRQGVARGNALENLTLPDRAQKVQIGVFVAANSLVGAFRTLDSLIREDDRVPLEPLLAAHYTALAQQALGLDPARAQRTARLNFQHLVGQQFLSDGGFSWGRGYSSTDYTLRALEALYLAQVPGVEYLKSNFWSAFADLQNKKVDTQSYLYQKVLHLAGEPSNLRTFATRDPLQNAELAHLFGDLNRYREALKAQEQDSQGLSIAADLTATSHALLAAVKLGQPEAPEFARWLAARLQGSTPRTVSDSALAAYAVAQHLRGTGMASLQEPVTVSVNGKPRSVSNVPALGTTVYFEGKAGQNSVQLSSNQLYAYTVTARYLTAITQNASSALQVERSYSQTTLKPNSTTEVRLKFRLKTGVKHLKLIDPIPAGFESLDPTAYQTLLQDAEQPRTLWSSKEHLDGATVIYLENLKAGEYTISYKLRSLAPGTYHTTAPTLTNLDTGEQGMGKSTVLTVKP